MAAFRLNGDERRAVAADVEVHDPGGTARILDHADLPAGRDVEDLRHHGRGGASPRPRRDRDASAADERDPLAPRDARCGAVVHTRERPELSAATDVPDTHGAVGAERREPRAVRAEPGREDTPAMSAHHVNRFAAGGAPEPRGAVDPSGCDEPPVRAVPRP